MHYLRIFLVHAPRLLNDGTQAISLLDANDKNYRQLVNDVLNRCGSSAGHGLPSTWFSDNIGMINDIFEKDSVQEIMDSLKSAKNCEWSDQTYRTLSTMCPLSLLVTHKMIKQGANLSMAECLQMEFRIAQRMMTGKDFFEGVRALIVDKDQNPVWSHSSIGEVSKEEIGKYFAPADQDLNEYELELPTERGDAIGDLESNATTFV